MTGCEFGSAPGCGRPLELCPGHAGRPWWCAPCRDADGHECPITLTAAAAP